jgi:cob(I)alamin adenosyltransferase
MKIYTKTGDLGMTSLIGGHRVPKYNGRIEAYGTVDELNSYLGLVIASLIVAAPKVLLNKIQSDLFVIGSRLAAPEGTKMNLPTIQEKDVQMLEEAIDALDESLPPLRNFVLPGGSVSVAHIHVARTICRRAERQVVYLAHELPEEQQIPLIITYLNRLSDYLFTLSRYESKETNSPETPWIPGV